MKKRDLITMFLCVPGAGLFALGMCMCLLPEWGAAVQGVWTGAAGIAVLLWAWVLHRIMSGKPAVRHFSGRSLIRGLIGLVGTLALGTGMCMTMLWGMLVPGVAVGFAGIVLLLCLIPLCRGIKE